MRIAAWQCRPLPLDVPANLVRLEQTCARAAGEGAEVLVVPELFLTGYAIGAEEVARLAEPADGPSVQAVATIARRHGVAIVVGFAERAADGRVYNAAALLSAGGEQVAVHRKVHLWGEVDAAQFAANPVAPEPFVFGPETVGLLICYDVEFPEAVRRLAVGGARLVLVPTANPVGGEEVQEVLLRARAVESGCAVVYANYCGTDGVLTYNGSSMVIGPDGAVLAQAPAEGEALLVADVTLGHAVGEDYLRGRRPELY